MQTQRPRLLVVDDDRAILTLIGTIALAEGFDVATTINGEDAMKQLRHRPAGLVLLDLGMPGVGGLDVLRAMLITGETGTGKELVARALHKLGPRSAKRFLTVNCSTVVETLFETAAGGTVFLDEVGELPLAVQAKLLRVLEEGEVQREHIIHTLDQVRGNKAVAARLLGVSRRAFYRQLERHGLHQRAPLGAREETTAGEKA